MESHENHIHHFQGLKLQPQVHTSHQMSPGKASTTQQEQASTHVSWRDTLRPLANMTWSLLLPTCVFPSVDLSRVLQLRLSHPSPTTHAKPSSSAHSDSLSSSLLGWEGTLFSDHLGGQCWNNQESKCVKALPAGSQE